MRDAVIRSHGHPHIRATHAKTIEITGDADITERATCVVGVAAEPVAPEVALLRGPVTVTLSVAGHSVAGTAVINPDHRVRGRAVLRRGAHRDADTLAVHSTLVSADLPRELVDVLARGDAEVTLRLTEAGPLRPLVILAPVVPSGGERVAVLWRHADLVVDARRRGPVPEPGPGSVVAVRYGDELPVELCRSLVGARFTAVDPAVEHVVALLAAGLAPTPALHLGRADRRHAPRLLAAAVTPVVLTVAAADSGVVLAALAPERPVAFDDGGLDLGTAMCWTTVGAHRAEPPDRDCVLVLPPLDAAGPLIGLADLVRALAAHGVSPRLLSEALAPLGVGRRAIYDALPR